MTHRDKPAIARETNDPCPRIEVIAEAIRSALPEACAIAGTVNEYPLARAVESALETRLPMSEEEIEARVKNAQWDAPLGEREIIAHALRNIHKPLLTGARESGREALLPCPFCGGEPHRPEFVCESGSKDIWTVRCLPCDYDLEGPRETSSKAEAAAVERWNTRASSASQGG